MKTVFILGAGFSVDAGAPMQADIIPKAIELYNKNPEIFDTDHFDDFFNFIKYQINIPENKFSKIAIEDIFTPLDRCLSESSQYRGISLERILRIRQSVFYVIGKTIQILLNNPGSTKNYITKFSKYLINESSVRQNKNYRNMDPVSVISTNWDVLLDHSIQQEIIRNNHNAVVDYCCYISSKDEFDETIKPGLEKLGQGGFNVKLLKLHGSLNWLQCPRCARLYAKFSGKEAIDNFLEQNSCRHCDQNFPEEANNHKLIANLIMPTFIKDLSNPQYKIIWQNAGIEISEAKKLVFIGYSLPSADFEMRQLLSRMTRSNVDIHVVDYCQSLEKQNDTKLHWESFFGNRNISFNFDGAQSYIETLTSEETSIP